MLLAFLDHVPPVHWFWQDSSERPTRSLTKVGAWKLIVTRDPFARTINCELRNHDISVHRASLVFQFSRKLDTFGALYSVDGAAAVSWRINAMQLAASGVSLQSDDVANPSGGKVVLPLSLARKEGLVVIRPSQGAVTRTFNLDGLNLALAEGRAQGCGAELAGPATE